MRKKIKAEEVQEEKALTEEQQQEKLQDFRNSLAHTGEAAYQMLMQWQLTNQLLSQLLEQGKRRNEILEEDVKEEEEE